MSIYIPGSALCPCKASGLLSQIMHRRLNCFFFLYSGVIMSYQHIQIPGGDRIVVNPDDSIPASEQPIIPYIEGDGIGADLTRAKNQPKCTARRCICLRKRSRRSKNMWYQSKGR